MALPNPDDVDELLVQRIDTGEFITLKGREAWALGWLMVEGEKGVTPLERPAPRWSGYIHSLRTKHGLDIETIDERHEGSYPGNHGRYVLHTPLRVRSVKTNEEKRKRA